MSMAFKEGVKLKCVAKYAWYPIDGAMELIQPELVLATSSVSTCCSPGGWPCGWGASASGLPSVCSFFPLVIRYRILRNSRVLVHPHPSKPKCSLIWTDPPYSHGFFIGYSVFFIPKLHNVIIKTINNNFQVSLCNSFFHFILFIIINQKLQHNCCYTHKANIIT